MEDVQRKLTAWLLGSLLIASSSMAYAHTTHAPKPAQTRHSPAAKKLHPASTHKSAHTKKNVTHKAAITHKPSTQLTKHAATKAKPELATTTPTTHRLKPAKPVVTVRHKAPVKLAAAVKHTQHSAHHLASRQHAHGKRSAHATRAYSYSQATYTSQQQGSEWVEPTVWYVPNSDAQHKLVANVEQVLTNMTYSNYQLGGNYLDTRRGVYKVDCSGYVDFLMQRANLKAYQTLRNYTGNSRPRTDDYYSFFKHIPYRSSHDHWYHMQQVDNLRPGDILVYRSQRNMSGHVMVVMGLPEQDQIAPDVYRVRVTDSAHSGHSNDSRGHAHSGIGVGTLLLRVYHNTHIPYAFAWSEFSHWQNGINIAMARPLE